MSTLGGQLRARRVQAGLSQTGLAMRTGIDQAHISRYERGIARPQAGTLVRLADALGCDVVLVPRDAS